MKILVACEESQAVTIELRKLGHEAYSNDLVDCTGGYPEWHLKQCVIKSIKSRKWDLIIMHPPCTAMTVSGNSTYGIGTNGIPKAKHQERLEAVEWTQSIWDLAISVCDKVAMENPVGVLNSLGNFPKPHYVQPYQFGHKEQKKTGFWLYGLEALEETNNVYEEMMLLSIKQRQRLHYLPPSKDRAALRSKTFKGIAQAMATQWTKS